MTTPINRVARGTVCIRSLLNTGRGFEGLGLNAPVPMYTVKVQGTSIDSGFRHVRPKLSFRDLSTSTTGRMKYNVQKIHSGYKQVSGMRLVSNSLEKWNSVVGQDPCAYGQPQRMCRMRREAPYQKKILGFCRDNNRIAPCPAVLNSSDETRNAANLQPESGGISMNPQISRCAVKPVSLALLALLALLGATPAFTADVTTIAGTGEGGFSGDGDLATAAALNAPDDVAVAADGTVYVADAYNLRIRRISPGGIISTIAGNGTYGDGGDGGQATAAELGSIEAIALSPAQSDRSWDARVSFMG